MNEELEKRQTKYKSRGLTAQPSIIEVKNDHESIFYIRVDNIIYRFDSFLKALDICFKMHFVLNLKYAHEINQTLLLIQKTIFKIDTEYDRVSPALSIFIKEIEVIG